MKTNTLKTALMLTLVLLCNTHVRAQWQWAQTYAGSTAGFGTGQQNYILRSHLDNTGNVYIFGQFGANATIDGVSSGLLDEERGSGWKNGVIVGKMGADGNFIWKKVVRSYNFNAGCGNINAQWAEFKEDAIYVLFNFECYATSSIHKLHFFGEEKDRAGILATNAPPFKTGEWTAFVKFSYDGEVLERHFIQINQRNYVNRINGLPSLSPFHVDNSGNSYIFTNAVSAGLTEDPYTLFLDNGATYTFYIPKTGLKYEPIIIKLNSNWQVQWVKSMYHNITDNNNATVDNPVNRFTGLSFDENDNMYLTGIIDINSNLDVPMYIYLAPNHRLAMNDETYLNINGYIVKYNTDGNAQWCNQLYSNNISSGKYFWGNEMSNNNVFVLSYVYMNNAFYNGEKYIEITSPIPSQVGRTFIAKFNKETGLYLNHGIVPDATGTGIKSNYQIPSKPAIINNYVIATTAIGTGNIYSKDYVIAKFRADNCQFAGVLDTVYFTNSTPESTTGSVRVNSNGDMFVHFTSGSNTMNLGNLPPVNVGTDNAVFALKNDPRLLIPYDSIHVTGITLNKNATTLSVSNTEQLISTVLPANASENRRTWSSSAPEVATINSGLITALSTGTATITVTTQDGGFTAQCVVTVNAAPIGVTGIELTPSAITLKVDDTEQLTATVLPTNASNKNVSWSSSAPAIASVDNNGVVTALSEGAATITVATEEGYHTAQCAVTVTKNGSGIDKVWANGVKIYPNPASSVLFIENGDLKINSVEITDFTGKTVIITGKNTNKIDVFALSQGIYFVKIYTDKGAVVKSFVKE